MDPQRCVCSREASWVRGRRGGAAAEITNRVLWWDLLEVQELGFPEGSSVRTQVGFTQLQSESRPVDNLLIYSGCYC